MRHKSGLHCYKKKNVGGGDMGRIFTGVKKRRHGLDLHRCQTGGDMCPVCTGVKKGETLARFALEN